MKNLPVPARAMLHAINIEAFCAIVFYSAGAGRDLPTDGLGGLLLAIAALLHVPGLILSSVAALPLSMIYAEYVTSWLWVANVAVCNTVFVCWVIKVSAAVEGAGHRAM